MSPHAPYRAHPSGGYTLNHILSNLQSSDRYREELLDDESSSCDEEEDIKSIQEEFEEEMKQEMEFQAASLTQSIAGTSSTTEKDGKDGTEENDELLYDPNADDEDEKWVENKRREYLGLPPEKDSKPPASGNNINVKKCPDSDTVLNCPGCMTVLCLDCQRHEVYETQYRAMFVLNCTIDWSEKLTSKDEHKKGNKKKQRKEKMEATWESIENGTDSYFFNVRCSVCNTQVAIYDEDEVFHLFNVLSSYS